MDHIWFCHVFNQPCDRFDVLYGSGANNYGRDKDIGEGIILFLAH